MWIKKTIVRVTVEPCEDLDAEFIQNVERAFPFYYTPFTRIGVLLRLVHKKCKLSCPYREELWHFMVWKNGELCWLDEGGKVAKLYKYLDCGGYLQLEYVYNNGIGAVVGSEDGITFFYHTKELRHVPHIHADYQGEEISIEILTLNVKGKFKNKKKQKKAVQFVFRNRKRLLEEYNRKTNGIRVFAFDI